ncbi:cohesin domain-containing protein, partial [Herbivorax sp. ANBcel31]|uniref:cohesin domain-containing protein n=1 Tax=Herbivorax sp. ANBcel31 TaxID=3069754 RepID=UPI0027AFC95C
MKKVISMLVVVAMLTAIFAAGALPDSLVSASQELTVKIGSVQGSTGTTVQIPVDFSGVPASGVNNCDFILSYDPDLLDVTEVTPGDIIEGGLTDFGSNVNSSDGRIATMFVDETGLGDRMIETDGTYAMITARVLSDEAASITLASQGAFADYDLNAVSVSFEDGGVNVDSSTQPPPQDDDDDDDGDDSDDSQPPVQPPVTGDGTVVTIDSVEASAGSTVEIPVYFSNVPSSGINNCDFIFWYEPGVIEVTDITPGSIIEGGSTDFGSHINDSNGRLSFMFVDETGLGNRMIEEDGVFATITANVLTDAAAPITLAQKGAFADYDLNSLDVEIVDGGVNVDSTTQPPQDDDDDEDDEDDEDDTPVPPPATGDETVVTVDSVEASVGSTVEIPVYFSDVPSSGINNCDFIFWYEPGVIEVTDITPGSIIEGGSTDFGSHINDSDGRLSFMFVDETGLGNRMIEEDGVFATITANVLTDAAAPITLAQRGAFADYDLNSLDVEFVEGGVNLDSSTQPPEPTPPQDDDEDEDDTPPPATGDETVVTIDSVEASVGSTVEIPIYFSNVPSSGINNCDFIFWYEPGIIEVTDITPGAIIEGGSTDFGSHINDSDGRLSFMFVDETGLGNRMIEEDGVFATITANVLTDAAAPITLAQRGAFADYDLNSLDVEIVEGGVNLDSSTPEPTPEPTPQPTPEPTPPQDDDDHGDVPVQPSGDLRVEFFNSITTVDSNSISPQFRLVNTGSSQINLADVTLRYYYTVDGDQSQTFWCDHAAKVGDQYEALTSDVSGSFERMSNSTSDADYYLEISFSSSAGSLEANRPVEIQGRFAKDDWSNYNQSNDYSFNANASSFTEWDKVTAYIDGQLVWGVEPTGSQPSEPTPEPTPQPTPEPTPDDQDDDDDQDDQDIPEGFSVVVDMVSGNAGDEVQIP